MIGAGVSAVSNVRVRLVLANYAASMLVLMCGWLFYRHNVFHLGAYTADWRPIVGGWVSPVILRFSDGVAAVFWAYAACLLPFYWFGGEGRGKALVFLEYLHHVVSFGRSAVPSESERQAMLTLLLKFIFVPFCVNGWLSQVAVFNGDLLRLTDGVGGASWFDFYDRRLHYLILHALFVIDFTPFVIGYLIECRAAGNRIQRVDPTLLGWVACLACYPPFNTAVGAFISWGSSDMVRAPGWPALVTFGLNLALVALFAGYAYASVCLGLRCSNLTARGVCDRGIYAVIRHPAYVLKNAAWWVAALPVLWGMANQSIGRAMWGAACLAGWTAIYAVRAITEEHNLRAVDGTYAAYCERVKWRFIPGVL